MNEKNHIAPDEKEMMSACSVCVSFFGVDWQQRTLEIAYFL